MSASRRGVFTSDVDTATPTATVSGVQTALPDTSPLQRAPSAVTAMAVVQDSPAGTALPRNGTAPSRGELPLLPRRLLEEVTEDVGGVRDEDATLTFIKSRETVVMQPVCGGTTGRGGCSKRGDRGCWVCS